MKQYNPQQIEKKWQKLWSEQQTFVAQNESSKPKKYVLIEFPYPSGEGLHMGHLRPYVAGDVYARYNRLRGFETMYPMGWDAFGLPAENFALKKGVHPAQTTAENIANAKRQVNSWGIGFDWSREVNTTDPHYYKWTQWIFLQFYKAGLAYEATGLINWCPKDKTGLANEEVIDGHCERCGSVVEKKEMKQWYLKITAYAEKLLQGLKTLDQWPESVKLQQANWIGKSDGAEIDFSIKDSQQKIKVFTTRPDTIFGVTYMVVAPEHPLLETLEQQVSNWPEVQKYIEQSRAKTDIDRLAEGKIKTGVELKGIKVFNPASGEEIPVWVADYVLGSYGTGAIMAVPAHDDRDFEFAQEFGLNIKCVVVPQNLSDLAIKFRTTDKGQKKSRGKIITYIPEAETPQQRFVQFVEALKNGQQFYTGEGSLINSGKFDGQNSREAVGTMAEEFGRPTVQYKLRDWVFSRQRYWGEPIPIIHCDECGIVPVPEEQLPVELPQVKKYEPTGTGESPLAGIDDWVNVKCPNCAGPAKRETNTMPQWAGSSWYYLRYTDPHNDKELAASGLLKYWLPVDVYFGGMEHTTLHLLYSRFWHLFLYDQGLVPGPEPYTKRVPHGIVLAADGEKMSKSRGNVVNPDDIVKTYGADTMRMYELFLGPHELAVSWNDQGIVGVKRFLDRVWTWVHQHESDESSSDAAVVALNKLVKKVTEDIENYRFNTAVAAFMQFHNEIKDQTLAKDSLIDFLRLLYPFAPHIAEELHEFLGGRGSLQNSNWPEFDPAKIVGATVQIIVQVNGKVREKLQAPLDATEHDLKQQALSSAKIIAAMEGQEPTKIIFVPNRLINIVVE